MDTHESMFESLNVRADRHLTLAVAAIWSKLANLTTTQFWVHYGQFVATPLAMCCFIPLWSRFGTIAAT